MMPVEGEGHNLRPPSGNVIDERKLPILHPLHPQMDDLSAITPTSKQIGQRQEPHGHIIYKDILSNGSIVVFKFRDMNEEYVHYLPPTP